MSKAYRGKAPGRADLPGLPPPDDHAALTDPSQRAYIRLEALRLAHRHDVAPSVVVDRAKAFEAYVLDDQPADKF